MKTKDAMITRQIRGVFIAILALSAMALPAAAQTSTWTGMAVAGDFTSWKTTPNMMLVANNLWQGEFYISTTSNRFKFVANNGWNYSYRETNQTPNFQVPITGTVDQLLNLNGGDITITNTQPGFYRFTFNDQTWEYRVDLLYTIASGVNILQNPSFEAQGANVDSALYWSWNPDTHGNCWNPGGNGTPRRHGFSQDWRAHSGSWEATIEGKWWSGRDDFGGWWRDGVAIPGMTYQGSAWFWADSPWTANLMELKIEFYDAGFTQLLVAASSFQGINQNWTKKTVSAMAPPSTAWARLVIASSGNGTQGALQFDDVELRPIVSRVQDFNLWGSYTSDGTYTWDDWMVSTGKATSIDARSGYCISLPWSSGVTNVIRSPQFVDGVGTITLWYRHGHSDTNTEPTNPVSFLVQKSPDGTTWTTIGSVSNILSQRYQAYSIFEYEPNPYYMRIVHDSGTNRLLIDDVTVAAPAGSPRYMDFNTWPDLGTNMGASSYLNWEVTTGRVSAIDAKDGKSLLLPANPSPTNYIRTPQFAGGYGDISFYYARGTSGYGSARIALQSSPDATNWSTIATVTNVSSTGYAQYQAYFYETNDCYLRICNLTNPPPDPTVLIDEDFIGGKAAPFGWTFHGISDTYESAANSGRAIPSIKFEDSGDYVQTPALASPTNLSFWLKGVSTGTDSNRFIVEQASGGPWTTITNISPLPTSGTTYSFPLATSVTNIRFTYVKYTGNAALDDVIVRCPVRPWPPPQDLLLDEINIDYPILLRTQDFNTWPTENSYGLYIFHGWIVNDGLIVDTNGYDGQVAHMSSASSGQYIQSPRMPEGIGTISFVYARWSASGPASIFYDIELSTNGTTWTYLDTINVTNTSYATYQRYRYDTTNHYLRLRHTGGGQIVSFDNISISPPTPPADVILNSGYTPSTPYTNDPVYLQGSVLTRYGASVLAVTSYYRIGTSGAFTALSMVVTDQVNYVSATAIPAQPAGTTVQYYIRCDFTGPGSTTTSPRYSPAGGATNPATYRIPRKQKGQVWINELNYVNYGWDDTNEFVEICGPSGFDIGGWKIEFYVNTATNTFTYYASYVISNNTFLSSNTYGFGFYVLGDQELPAANQRFTHTNNVWWDGYSTDSQISDGYFPSGVRLINEGNDVEQSIAYDGAIAGFNNLGAAEDLVDYPDPFSLQLAGTGSNYAGFAWQTNTYTPGAVNFGQTFEGGAPEPAPDIPIGGMIRGSTQLSIMMTATNGWGPEVRYTTGLLPNPQSWTLISPRTVTTNAGVWTIQFTYPVGPNNCCFRVEMLK